jgi:ATP-binding cassette subfamily B protein
MLRVLGEARPFWRRILGVLALNLLATPLVLLLPIPLKIAIDSVIGKHPAPDLLRALVPGFWTSSTNRLLILVVFLQVLFVLLARLQALSAYVLGTQTAERLTLAFRSRLFRQSQRLSLSFHDARGTTDSVFRIQYDAPAIQYLTIEGLLPLLSELVMLIAMFAAISTIDWTLGLVALAVSPFLFAYGRAYNNRMRPRYVNAAGLESSALSVIQEVLGAFRVVKAFGREDSEQQRFARHSGESVRARIRLAVAEGSFGLIVNTTTAIGTAAVLYLGVRHVQSGAITIGQLLIVLTYLSQLYQPLENISQQAANLQGSLASAQRAFELLDADPDVRERADAVPLSRARGAVEFRDVSFAYDGVHRVLEGVSFAVEPGTRVGIAGRTGAGKTTLISLLMRFYDPTAGAILLDGKDLAAYRLRDLRNQFAIVLQEPVLFSTSIAENIAYAREEATRDEIVEAAKAAAADEFIAALPDGYDTVVGERGMLLSGGERQRIALARAFLKDAPILILDEPTSSIDVKTEAEIMAAMERLMEGRTTLMIAHRLTTLESCDMRIELEGGRVLEASAVPS